MINFNKTNINVISLAITTIIFIAIIISIQKISSYGINEQLNQTIISSNQIEKENKEKNHQSSGNEIESNKSENNKTTQNKIEEDETSSNDSTSNELPKEWSIEIKSVNISGNIIDIDEEKTPEDAIGHIKETSINGNNIALIAYNSGKPKNYFAHLKELKAGEEIIYSVNNIKRRYKVIFNKVIEKEDLSKISNEKNEDNYNYLKLFTYVIDLEDKLRYVCAREKINVK